MMEVWSKGNSVFSPTFRCSALHEGTPNLCGLSCVEGAMLYTFVKENPVFTFLSFHVAQTRAPPALRSLSYVGVKLVFTNVTAETTTRM